MKLQLVYLTIALVFWSLPVVTSQGGADGRAIFSLLFVDGATDHNVPPFSFTVTYASGQRYTYTLSSTTPGPLGFEIPATGLPATIVVPPSVGDSYSLSLSPFCNVITHSLAARCLIMATPLHGNHGNGNNGNPDNNSRNNRGGMTTTTQDVTTASGRTTPPAGTTYTVGALFSILLVDTATDHNVPLFSFTVTYASGEVYTYALSSTALGPLGFNIPATGLPATINVPSTVANAYSLSLDSRCAVITQSIADRCLITATTLHGKNHGKR